MSAKATTPNAAAKERELARKPAKARRFLIRAALAAAYLALLALSFSAGKGHSLLIDNKDTEDGSAFALPEGFTVSIDGRESVTFEWGLDRDIAKLKGQRHRVVVDKLADGRRVEGVFWIPIGIETALLSIPKLVAGIEPALSPFIAKASTTAIEVPVGESFSSPDAVPVPSDALLDSAPILPLP